MGAVAGERLSPRNRQPGRWSCVRGERRRVSLRVGLGRCLWGRPCVCADRSTTDEQATHTFRQGIRRVTHLLYEGACLWSVRQRGGGGWSLGAGFGGVWGCRIMSDPPGQRPPLIRSLLVEQPLGGEKDRSWRWRPITRGDLSVSSRPLGRCRSLPSADRRNPA